MKKHFFSLTFFLAELLFSCSNVMQERLDLALNLAENNKSELEKVLLYYKEQPSKLKAAQFLIANMPYHYAYVGWQIDSLKQLKKESIAKGKISEEVVKKWNSFNFKQLAHNYDIKTITSQYLIENIDLAFKVWEERPWSKYYSFEDFCEYVLPYRIEDEPLENWRQVYYEKYAPILDSLYQGTDVVIAAQKIADYLKQEGFSNYTDFTLPHLGALFLFENRVGYCRENCDIATYVMRALGIPISMDFYETSPSYNSRHFWSALIDTTHLAVPFNYIEKPISRQPDVEARKKGKVYRICYGIQPEKIKGRYSNKRVPILFRNPLLRDVSNEYFPNSSVLVHLDKEPKDKLAYLSIFTGRTLEPIDIAETKGKQAIFNYVEPQNIYFPSSAEAGKMTYAGYPFLLHKNEPVYFIPDTTTLQSVVLTRKYPMRNNANFFKNACGVKVEGANRKDFKDAELLYEVIDTPMINYNILSVGSQNKFRYIRYSAPPDKKIELGEWYMYDENEEKLIPEKIWANHPLSDVHKRILSLMTDDDWSSFYMSEVKGEQLIFDLGKPRKLHHFLFIPRNDDNFIRPGDTYELFYHQGRNGWISLGKQRAQGTILYYEAVPTGALLWLRNWTRGKEERCFYMDNEKQFFI